MKILKQKSVKILLAVMLIALLSFATVACTPDSGDNGGGSDTKLAKVTGFSYDNTGYWKWNEVSGAEQYTVMIDISPIYYLTVQQSDVGANGKFTVGTGSIPVGNHTAMIVARAEGKTDSDAATCTANVSSAGETITLTITNANYDNATKTLSWDKVTNATGYTAALRRQGTGQYITIPQAQVSEGEGYEGQPIMKAVVNYDLVKQAFTVAGEGNDLSGPVEFKITAQGSTQGLTTYADGEHIFTKTYAITKLAKPSVSFEATENWYTKKVLIQLAIDYYDDGTVTDITKVTDWEITLDNTTLDELDIELTFNENENRMEFTYSVDSNGKSVGFTIRVKALSITDGINNVHYAESAVGSTVIGFVRPADAATYDDVLELLMPKISTCLISNMPSFDKPETLVLKGFNLSDGKVYFEFVNPGGVTRIAQGTIWQWASLNPQKYEDIISHLSDSTNSIQSFSQYTAGTTWESVLADLGGDYWGGENLYAYKVIDVLMPKIVDALRDYVGLDSDTVELKGFNLTDGKVYFEFLSPIHGYVVLASADIWQWVSLNPQRYDDIVNHLSNLNNGVKNEQLIALGGTWETVRAGLTDYYSIWNLSGYLAAQN